LHQIKEAAEKSAASSFSAARRRRPLVTSPDSHSSDAFKTSILMRADLGEAGKDARRQRWRDLPRQCHAATAGASNRAKSNHDSTTQAFDARCAASPCRVIAIKGRTVMRKLIMLCAWLCAVAFVVAANPARAQNSVSYVSNTGNDAHGCSNPTTDACASFQHALTQTTPLGEIDCVSAGDYNFAFIIAQSVTIDCAGGVGFSEGVITVNGAGIVVHLRNLSLNRIGLGGYSIEAKNMAALYVENCVITNSNSANETGNPPYIGIEFEPSANAQLFVSNSVISNNGSSGSSLSGGIYIVPGSSATAEVSIDHSQINGNYFGIVGDGRSGGIIKGTISDSVVSGSIENGITAISSGSSTVLLVDQTKVTNNSAAGIFVSGSNAGILARNSIVYGNAIGLDAIGGGTLYTCGNNSVNGNATNGTFTGTAGLQ
jgi:hypothetical protein